MVGIGEKLKETRLKKNLTLNDVENKTKIRARYIQALEEEDFSVLPGSVYIKGFLKTYGKLLELDDKELIAAYEGIEPQEEEVQPQPVKRYSPEQSKGPNRRYIKLILGIIAIATLIGVQNLYLSFNQDREMPQQPDVGLEDNLPGSNEGNLDDQEEPNTPGKNPEIEEPEEEEQGIDKLVLTIEVEEDCWVRVYGDGKIAYEKTMVKGEIAVIEAEEKITFTLGNAGAAKVLLGDEDLGILGNKGEVTTQSFSIEDYQ